MGVIDNLTNLLNKRATKKTSGNPQNPQYWVQKLFGSAGNTAAGIYVDEENALSATAVWRAVSLVAQTIGALPLHMYEREGDRTKSKASNHKLYYTLHSEPNPEQSKMEFQEMLQAHALTWGRAHAEIEYTGTGGVRLWPLTPDRVEPLKTKERDTLVYRIHLPNGGSQILLRDQVFTLRGLGYGLNQSYNVITLFRESIGLTLAAEEFGSRFFSNGATLGGILSHPNTIGDEAFKQLRQSLEEKHQGLEQAHRFLILEEGMQYKETAVPPDKAQFLETRKYQINDVARIIGVPPHKLAEMTQSTFSNIEHQSIEFMQDTLNPWCVRWEQALARQLLSPTEKKTYFFKHNLAGLVRGDFKTRMEGYAIARQNGWLSANDIREFEDMNPIDGGDIYLQPLNMAPAGEVNEPEPDPEPENNSKNLRTKRSIKRTQIIKTFKPLIRNAAEEIIKRERADVLRQAERIFKNRNIQAFNEWLAEFYEEHKDYITKKITPVLTSFAETIHADAAEEIDEPTEMNERHKGFLKSHIAGFAALHAGLSQSKLQEAAKKDDPIAELEAQFDQWEKTRIDSIAEEEAVKGGNAIAKMTYIVGQRTELVWNANAGACEFCQSLDGRVVGIEKHFVMAGGSISSATGASPPMTVSSNVSYPPVHRGCECFITSR